MTTESQQKTIAQALHQARNLAQPVEQWSSQEEFKGLTPEEAYNIQEMGMALRQEEGEKLVGLKMGLTAEAKRQQMNLDSPLYGHLTDRMEVPHKGTFHLKGTIHPKIEPEVAFFISKELKGPQVTREEVLEATEAVSSCLEILDSRYSQFKYFSLEDVIADNSSSCMFALGEKFTDFRSLDLKNLRMTMKVNGEAVQEGNSQAISGDPVISVQQLCSLLWTRNQGLIPGQVVLAGAATAALMLEEGMEVSLDVEGLKTVSVGVKK